MVSQQLMRWQVLVSELAKAEEKEFLQTDGWRPWTVSPTQGLQFFLQLVFLGGGGIEFEGRFLQL